MKTVACFLLFAALALSATTDVNVSGKWSGSFNATTPDGGSKESTALLLLKQNGTEITGSVGPDEERRYPIQKGKIEGDKITLEVQEDNHIVVFELVATDERIKGNAHVSAEGDN